MNKHTAPEVVAQLLCSLSIGTNPIVNGPWPVFVGQMGTEPDTAISVMDQETLTSGRNYRTGEMEGHELFQIKIRGKSYPEARLKTIEIANTFDGILRRRISVEDKFYQVQCFNRLTSPVYMGPDPNHRISFVLNYTTTICEVQ